MDIENILSKALGIANDKKFTVKSFGVNDMRSNETKELTYLQLGTELITNSEGIKEIHIIYKDIE